MQKNIQRAALTAGLGLLAMTVLSVYGILMTIQKLWVHGDAAQTAANIAGADGAFRLGVACVALVAVLDVVVAWALKAVFDPVSEAVSGLAATLRVAYAAVLLVAVGHLVTTTQLLTAPPSASGLDGDHRAAQALLQLGSFDAAWQAGLILSGCHLVLLGYLAIRATYVPTWLGLLLLPAGAGYIVDSFGLILVSNYSISVSAFTFVGEALLMVWLLVRSPRIRVGA